jgi:hypothetical protein
MSLEWIVTGIILLGGTTLASQENKKEFLNLGLEVKGLP